jgi:DNA-binding NarL/FixJ family response regulator
MNIRRSMKVLIADDSPLLRQRASELIGDIAGVEIVGQAADCSQTVAAVAELRPDLVVLDIAMPGGTGIEVLQALKRSRRSPVVIVFTNYPFPQFRQRALAAGADYFFDKSGEFLELRDTVARLADHPQAASPQTEWEPCTV